MTSHGGGDRQHRVRGHAAVLDIGGNIGALLIYTPAGRSGSEIEVCRAEAPRRRIHSVVHPRLTAQTAVYAAVFPELEAGDYLFCGENRNRRPITVTGGVVAELDWR